jgi:NAD(P)-dependent dehydrogenase (short-subunit alcohol dehydrogenase family)
MTPDLTGKVALVTGGASGLGAATCRALAATGAAVVVADITQDAGRAVAEEIGGHFIAVDVSTLEANEAMVAAAVEQYDGLDFVYLNAGISTGCGIGDSFDLDRYRRAMAINLDGVVFGMQAALPAVSERRGAFVATASLAGLTAVPLDPFYAANKHAVVGLARSVGPALGEQGVRFNAVCPGFSESQIIKDFRQDIIDSGVPIIPAEKVADTVVGLFAGTANGECWFVQAGREPAPFGFRGIPGPRAEEEATA